MLIEQAIFTSAKTDRSDGYHVVVESPGLSAQDARELAVLGPSHDALIGEGYEASSVNFHPLPSGEFCVSKTMYGGHEYSERRGRAVYTHCLVVPTELLERFSNNPFAVLRAAMAQGAVTAEDEPPDQLDALRLLGRSGVVDERTVQRVASTRGALSLAGLVEDVIRHPGLAVVLPAPDEMIECVFHLLPVSCRTAISFTTGLRFSLRRPVRVLCLNDDQDELRRCRRQGRLTVLHRAAEPTAKDISLRGWAGFVQRSLENGQLVAFRQALEAIPASVTLDDLDALGHRLADAVPPPIASTSTSQHPSPGLPASDSSTGTASGPASGAASSLANASLTAAGGRNTAIEIGGNRPEQIALLDALDNAILEAITGNLAACHILRELWPQAIVKLTPEVVEDSKEHYIRRCIDQWQECLDGNHIRDARRALAVVDVITTLLHSP